MCKEGESNLDDKVLEGCEVGGRRRCVRGVCRVGGRECGGDVLAEGVLCEREGKVHVPEEASASLPHGDSAVVHGFGELVVRVGDDWLVFVEQ